MAVLYMKMQYFSRKIFDMKKILLSLFVIFSFGYYAYSRNESTSGEQNIQSEVVSTTIKVESVVPTSIKNEAPKITKPIVKSSVVKPSGYKDGEYLGGSFDAYYGYVQVKVIVKAGRISDVVFLDFPQHSKTSREINSEAMPILKMEAIRVQNENVSIVSGATETSRAFRKSLSSAISKAR